MSKTNRTSLVSASIIKEIQNCRPLRLYITKKKKKGHEENAFALRSKFLQLSAEKQRKYFQKAVDKYVELLEEKQLDKNVQIQGQLFDDVLSKKEQKIYFQSLNAPVKPLSSAAAYYSQAAKENPKQFDKAWKYLSSEEKQPYIELFLEAKEEYNNQMNNFAANLPDRLRAEYLSFVKQTAANNKSNSQSETDERPAPVIQRRKSVQPIPEQFKVPTLDHPAKLTRAQLDQLHKCKPGEIYYEKKVPDDDKPTFPNVTARNVHIRLIFNQLSEKKRKKFVLKAVDQWTNFLQSNPNIVEQQIPTLHLLLGRVEDMLIYFNSLGLPPRPAASALQLFSQERESQGSQQNWNDLSQTIKDEYIKRAAKGKTDYYQQFFEFVEKTLPSDYIRLELFRNIKYASKDYEIATKDRTPPHSQDAGQSKITQYMTKKNAPATEKNDFQQIHQKLLATKLTNEQKDLVERLGNIMHQWVEEKTTKKSSRSTIVLNGDTSNDEVPPKKRKHEKNNDKESSSAKKRK